MYEYSVIFTSSGQKFAILIKEANTPPEAIDLAIVEAKAKKLKYEAIEVISVLS